MTSLATIVFKSGVAVEVPFGDVEAAQLLQSYDENWDEDGPQIVLPPSARSSGCRLVPSEIVGIFVSEAEDEEEDDEDEDEDEELVLATVVVVVVLGFVFGVVEALGVGLVDVDGVDFVGAAGN